MKQKLKKFERLVLRHRDSAFNLAHWLTRNQDEARNLAQEALLQAFKSLDVFQDSDERLGLLTLVRKLYFSSALPPPPTLPERQLQLPPESSSSPEILSLRNADSQLVRQALEELPLELREPLVLRELETLSYREIAAVMEITLGTVLSRLAQARDALHHALTLALKRKAAQKEGQNAVPGKH